MRFLVILAAVALLAVVVVLVLYAFGDRRKTAARWEAHTESSDGVTTVVVRQMSLTSSGQVGGELGRQTVAAIPDGDPEWETRYHDAMAQARSRVAALESESD